MEADIQHIKTLIDSIANQPSPWIPFWAAMIVAAITAWSSYYVHKSSVISARSNHLQNLKREALLQALDVIDLVYQNTEEFSKNPKEWDLALARSAVNQMLIYCDDPEAVIKAFERSIGLHNPTSENPSGYNAASVNDFRAEVCRELGLSKKRFFSKEKAWISSLPGGK